jgi:crotonobetainyl-CoA:carnitine CoA-transferase CaiB-like acyl-CoA transferase
MEAKPARLGLTHALLAPYGAYHCGDGNQIWIAIQNNRECERFCDQNLNQPDLGTDPRFRNNPDRVAHRADLDAAINRVFQAHPRETIAARLQDAKIAWSRLSSLDDLSDHPLLRQAQARIGNAVVDLVDLPVKTDGPRPELVPDLGQHSDIIRQEFSP